MRKQVFLLLALLLVPNAIFAQQIIKGRILDDTGEVIVGATIYEKDAIDNATISNLDGMFNLECESNSILIIYSIGYSKKEVSVNNQTDLGDIILSIEDNEIGEVVVTAMGLERKKESLTYATQEIKNEDLMVAQDPNFINSLQGKAAGLSITPNAGGAGGSSKILLRGNKSILGNNQPLVVIDGIPMSNPVQGKIGSGEQMGYGMSSEGSDALSAINPEDIESVNILKGANAAALYGSMASNGVLMITTKKGKEGRLEIKVSSNANFETPLKLPKFQNIYGSDVNLISKTISGHSWGKKMAAYTKEELNVGGIRQRKEGRNDARDFFNLGSTYNNSISLSGGTEKMKTYFSYGNTHADGMIQNNTFDRHSLALRQSYSFFKEVIKIEVSLNYVNQNTQNRPGGGTNQNPIYHLYTATRSADMDYYRDSYKKYGKWMSNDRDIYKKTNDGYVKVKEQVELEGERQNWIFNSADQNNPYWLTNKANRVNKLQRVYGYVAATINITKDLSTRFRYSLDRSKAENITEKYATTQYPASMSDYGWYGQNLSTTNEFYLDGLVSFNKEIYDFSVSSSLGITAHKIESTNQWIGEDATYYDYRQLALSKKINIFSPHIGSGASRSYAKNLNWDNSLFFTTQLGYKNYVFIEGSYRIDRYRAFVQFNKTRGTSESYGYFSFGGNTLLHNYLDLPEFISNFKLRTSYSEVGNSIPNVIYNKSFKNGITGGVSPSKYAYFENPIPEKMKSFEAGFDLGLLRNSLNWNVTLYNSTMNNNYLNVGVAGKIKPVNTGVIRNMGVETNISYGINITKDLFWRTNVNFSFNDNEILETYINPKTGKESLISQSIGFRGKFQLKYKKGGRYGDLYATDFERNADGTIKLDGDGTPKLSSDQYGKFVGNMNSKYMLGWSNSFSYKGFKLSILVDGRIGGKVVSFTEAYLDRFGLSQRTADARQNAENNSKLRFTADDGKIYNALRMEDGQLAPIQKYYEGVGGDINATQYVYDATNFRLREMSLGYTFKDLFGQNKHLSASLVARNLAFIYVSAPVDPDTSLSTSNGLGSFDIFNMPTARSFGFSLSLSL